ncbi:MAG: hypothetical protein IJS12_09930 [Lachnospiraceae bacterium]|nr:hypothetical protein [Lachnospiraceae bacterium]
MRNPKMIKRISVKCMAAIMGAAAVMSPATAAMGIVIEADATDYATIDAITPDDQNHINLESGDTLASNTGTIHKNEGTININTGTVDQNYGTVSVNDGGTVTNYNGGTVTNNDGGSVANNSGGTVTNNNSGGSVTNNSGGVVVNNYSQVNNNDGGRVTDNNGTVANQNSETSIVERNNPSGTVSRGTVTDNYGTADHARISGNYGVASDSNVTNNYASGRVTGDSTVADNHGGYIQNPSDTTRQHPAYSGPNPLTPPAPQPSGDSGDDDDPAPAPAPQPVDNTGGDSSSMGSLTVLPSETPTIQQEEKSFVNTLNSEMAKLADASTSAASGLAGQQTINVNMGANNSYTSGMIAALETAADKNVAVAMTLQENGQHMTFTVPAGSDYSAVDSYFEQTASTSEGYRMIQSLVSGSVIEDSSGNKNVNTTDMGTLMIKADADAILHGIDYSATIVAGGGSHGPKDYSSSSNNSVAVRTAIGQNPEIVAYGGAIATQTGSEPAVAITSGGTAIDTTVNGGGSQTVHIANTAMAAAVTSGGTVTISAGTMGDKAMTAAGTSGGTTKDTSVNGGGSQTASGDIATSTIAINGGSQTEIGRIHASGAVVATGTLPDKASQSGTYAVTDDRSVLIANDQGVFLASKGSIQKLE